ncbi:MAG TPA: GNAT family N-acetyltransferase, partial [Mycobacterium sp.]
TRGYLRIDDDNQATADLAGSLGFVLHHRARYVTPTT